MSFTVLIVDDSTTVRSILSKTMQIANEQVGDIFEASNGGDALKILHEKRVDLVFTDINMPGINGVEMIRSMQANETMKGIPVVVVSTEGSETRKQDLEALGVRAYIRKPFKPEQISEVVGELLGKNDERSS